MEELSDESIRVLIKCSSRAIEHMARDTVAKIEAEPRRAESQWFKDRTEHRQKLEEAKKELARIAAARRMAVKPKAAGRN